MSRRTNALTVGGPTSTRKLKTVQPVDSSGGLHGDTPTPKRLHGVVDICGENQSQTHAKSAKTGATARADNVQKHTQLQVASSIVTYVTSSPEQLSEDEVLRLRQAVSRLEQEKSCLVRRNELVEAELERLNVQAHERLMARITQIERQDVA